MCGEKTRDWLYIIVILGVSEVLWCEFSKKSKLKIEFLLKLFKFSFRDKWFVQFQLPLVLLWFLFTQSHFISGPLIVPTWHPYSLFLSRTAWCVTSLVIVPNENWIRSLKVINSFLLPNFDVAQFILLLIKAPSNDLKYIYLGWLFVGNLLQLGISFSFFFFIYIHSVAFFFVTLFFSFLSHFVSKIVK